MDDGRTTGLRPRQRSRPRWRWMEIEVDLGTEDLDIRCVPSHGRGWKIENAVRVRARPKRASVGKTKADADGADLTSDGLRRRKDLCVGVG
jgi:hypothetical protein